MWSCRQEEAVLKARREIAHRTRDMGVDRIARPAGWRGVVSFVKYEQAAGAEGPQPVPERSGIGFVDEQPVRDEESLMSIPGIHTEAAFFTDPLEIVLVRNLKT